MWSEEVVDGFGRRLEGGHLTGLAWFQHEAVDVGVGDRIGNLNRGHFGLLEGIGRNEPPSLHVDAAVGIAGDPALVGGGDAAAVGEAADPGGFQSQRERSFCFGWDDDAFENAAVGAAVFDEEAVSVGELLLLGGGAGAGD